MADCEKDITSAAGDPRSHAKPSQDGTPISAVVADKKDVRNKKKATNDNVELSNLEQYILSQNIDKAADYFTSNSGLFNYKTFRQVTGKGAQLVNRLRGIDNLDVFYKIKTSVLSLMRPKIRLYKVNYEEFAPAEDGSPDQTKVVSLPQPCYKEFKFSDNFGMETAVSVQDYLAYESTRPHWRNVGLKSFSVKQDGKKLGIIENNIECTLTVTFKSLKDLQASPPGEPPPGKGGLRYVDLITWSPARIDSETDTYNPKHYEVKALLGYTAPSKQQLQNLNLTQKDIDAIANVEKLNVLLSLSLYNYDLKIKDDGQVEMVASYRGRLETTIGTNQVSIFQNTFRVTKNGAVDVSRKVNAKHNISKVFKLQTNLNSIQRQLKSATCKDDTCKGRKNLRDLVEKDAFFQVILKEVYATGGNMDTKTGISSSGGKMTINGDGSEMFSFFKEIDNVDKVQSAIKKKIGLYKKDVYKTFVDQLIDGNTEADNAPGTRLFCINAGTDEVQKSLGILVDDKAGPGVTESDEVISIDEVSSSTTTAIPQGKLGFKIDRCHLVSPIDPKVKSAVAEEIASQIDTQPKAGEEKKDPGRVSVKDFSGKSHKFYFVYLGDIVELACKNAGLGVLDLKPANPNVRNEGFSIFPNETYFPKDNENSSVDYPLKNARMLLGPIEYVDNKGEIKSINLAQFPISFNYFRAWFMRKVVRRRRTQMPLGSFLVALLNDLVMPALGVGMPKTFKPPKTNSSIVSLTLPGKTSKTDGQPRFSCGSSIGKFEEALPMRQKIDVSSARFEEEYYSVVKGAVASETLIKTSYDYLLMYVTTHKNIIERRGDPAEDVPEGVYHFNIGSDMGLLRSMDFKRVAVPFLVELRAKQAEEQGVDSLEQLKFPYDTTLKLIGTSLFTPGMFYYVNPSLAGLGSVEDAGSLAYQMNLGGYHLVYTVTTTVTADSFTTDIIGKQTSQGRR
tara:strand:+ start:11546 stop:14419 length:2874 start_codon:yes stop_codon:yes gene_type:complete